MFKFKEKSELKQELLAKKIYIDILRGIIKDTEDTNQELLEKTIDMEKQIRSLKSDLICYKNKG